MSSWTHFTKLLSLDETVHKKEFDKRAEAKELAAVLDLEENEVAIH